MGLRLSLSPGKGLACAYVRCGGARGKVGLRPTASCGNASQPALQENVTFPQRTSFKARQVVQEPPHFTFSSSNYIQVLLQETKICSPKFSTRASKELKNKNHFPVSLASSLIPGHDPTLITIQMPVSEMVAMYSGI